MRYLIFLVLITNAIAAQDLNLVPRPAELETSAGTYQVKKKMNVYSGFQNKFLTRYLREELLEHGVEVNEVKQESSADIILFPRRMPSGGKLGYELIVNENGVRLNANFDESAFNGIQTIIQLFENNTIPYLKIYDHPAFPHRGMHLDVTRHFFPVGFIKRYIDYLAYHKMNSFHWHLTDDQGWRIEIKKYPRLTTVGGYRNGTIIGRYPGTGNDNIRYGGYYTQQEIKDVVAYAKERFINVIPEIEMPAHSGAAIAAYPELSCFPAKPTVIPGNMISEKSRKDLEKGSIKVVQETWGVFEDVFCAGKESTFVFLENVLDEVCKLFPSQFIHIGGDECLKNNWKNCPDCQTRIRDNKLKNAEELQSYFITRIEKYINHKGKTIIGWDEILEGGLAPNAVVMSWRGEKGGIEAAKQKHNVIMSPGDPLYFDHTQSLNDDSVTFGGFNPIEKVYTYKPIPPTLSMEDAKHILGAQANVWTEYMKNTRKIEYMIFPRMSALSEVLWTPENKKSWAEFEKKIPALYRRYEKWNSNYSLAYYDLNTQVIASTDPGARVMWKLQSRNPKARIVWTKTLTIDDPPNPAPFNEYTGPIPVESNSEYRAWSIIDGQHSAAITQKFQVNSATGKKITLKEQASASYPGDGALTVINGVINEKALGRSREFLGFLGKDFEAVIDLEEVQNLSFVVVNALNQRASWIWQPRSAEILGSVDGNTFYPLGATDSFNESKNGKGTMLISFRSTPVRYVKLIVKNYGKIPDGNPGAGTPAWLFIDEIEIDGPN